MRKTYSSLCLFLLGSMIVLPGCPAPANNGDASTGDAMMSDDLVSPDAVAPDGDHHEASAAETSMEDGAAPDVAMMPEGGSDVMMGGPADWGFRSNMHGFTFENYTNNPPVTNLTPVEMRRLFGPQVCEGAASTGACTLVPQAQQWMERQNNTMNGGHCEGMAVVASHLYSGALEPMMFGAPNIRGLMLRDSEALQREVALWFVTQSTFPNERRDLTPRQVVEELSRDLAMGRAFRGTVVGLYTSPGRGNGHAITPYAIRRPSANIAEILAYDNNYPNEEKVVTVDLEANTFRYVTSTNPAEMPLTYAGDATTMTLTLADVGPRLMLPHMCSFCGDAQATGGMMRGSVQVALTGEGNLAISDEMGRMTGYDNMGRLMNGIPGATYASTRSNFRDSPEPVYNVPRAGTLTLTLDGSRLTNASASELLITGEGFSVGIENLMLDPMQRDTITFRTSTPDITYRSSGTETPSLVLTFQRPGADYHFELRSGAFTAGQVLRLGVDFEMQRARISFDGSTSAPTFEVYMERVTEMGSAVFRHTGVTSSTSSVIYLSYAGWTGDGGTLRMEVDNDNNGTIDRMEELSDQP